MLSSMQHRRGRCSVSFLIVARLRCLIARHTPNAHAIADRDTPMLHVTRISPSCDHAGEPTHKKISFKKSVGPLSRWLLAVRVGCRTTKKCTSKKCWSAVQFLYRCCLWLSSSNTRWQGLSVFVREWTGLAMSGAVQVNRTALNTFGSLWLYSWFV